MVRLLTFSLWIFFVVEFIRALPWPMNWATRRPLSCRVCLVGWVVIGLSLMIASGWEALRNGEVFFLVAAGGGALGALTIFDHLRSLGVPLVPPSTEN